MLLPEQVIPFLGSEDTLVRRHAGRYFVNASDVGPLTAVTYWRILHSLGLTEENRWMIDLLRALPQDERFTQSLLAALDTSQDGSVREDLLNVLNELDFAQLRQHADAILARTDLPEETLDHLRARLELAGAPAAAPLWDEIKAYYENLWEDDGGYDPLLAFRLIEALARFGQETIDRAVQLVGDRDEPDLQVVAVELLARLRHRPALEPLVQALARSGDDDDMLHEALQYAIPVVGGADAVASLESLMPNLSWDLNLYACEMLGRIKHPSSEEAILRLLDDPRMEEFHTELAGSLTALCTTKGLPRLREIFLAGDYDQQMIDLRGDLVACTLMAGPEYEFPEFQRLREEAVAAEIRLEQRRAELARLVGSIDFPSGGDYDDDDDEDMEYDDLPDLPSDLEARGPRVVAPIQNTGPKVGRNDPCPCGSGKKYKKCCLNKQG
jgi:hypothetical protein